MPKINLLPGCLKPYDHKFDDVSKSLPASLYEGQENRSPFESEEIYSPFESEEMCSPFLKGVRGIFKGSSIKSSLKNMSSNFCGFVLWLIVVLSLVFPCAAMGETVRLGTWKTAQTIQPFFYDRFLPKTDQAQVFAFTNPADQKVALLAGSLEICGTTLAHAIHAASKGEPVVLVAALCNKCSALVVKADGPVFSVKDLKGKRVGYVPGTMHEILLRETLSRNGLSPETDIQLTRVDFFDMAMALARGGIDAFLSGEPFPTLAVDKGYGRILSYPYFDDSIGTINAGILVKRKTIENDPDLVFRLVLAHAMATEYLKAEPQQWLKKASSFGTQLRILEVAAGNMELAWKMDPAFVKRTRMLGEKMQSLGVIDRQPDYDTLFDLTFVDRVADHLKENPINTMLPDKAESHGQIK